MSQPKWVYGAEYALSDRSSCKKCSNGIGKNVVRLCIKSKSRFHDGDDVLWHHPRCFFQKKPNVNVDEIWHFHDLRPEDQARIRKLAMGKGKAVEEDESEGEEEEAPIPKGKGKRGKTSKGSESAKKKQKGNKEDVDDSSLLQQTMLIWKCKDQVSSNIPAAAQKKLLEANDQHIPVAGKVLDRVVDMLLFGATEKCQDCASATGFLVISADAYYCIGHASEWAKCDIRTQEPRRKAPHIPADLLKKYPFLEEYASYQPRRRLFASCFQTNQNGHAVDALKSSVTVVDGPSSSGTPTSRGTVVSSKPRKLAKGKPLKNLKIGVVGKLPMKRTEMNAAIKQLGGAVVTKASKDTFVVISDQASIAARVVMLEMAEVCQVQVVPLDFLEECRGGRIRIEEDLEDLVERIKLSSWKTIKPFERVRAMKQESISLAGLSSSEAHLLSEQRVAARKYTVTDEKMKVLVKNGGAVDPASDLDEKTHSVCKENGIVYSCVLAKTDIQTGSNSFYKLQIIKEDKRSNYYLFRSWGRIGTTIGGNMCEEMEKEDAVSTFEFHFMDKSGNEWKDRERFVKKPSRYFIMELDYGPEEPEQEYTVAPGSKSTLHRAIQDLIKLIFDVEEMKKTMKEFEIDLRKMPLGKLSRRQITDAMKVLSELQLLVQNGERLNSPKMVDASNRFFTLIPHDFGVNAPPLLNQLTVIKEKLEMLDNLLEIEVAFNILRGENRQSDRDPVDQHYEKLKCEMDVVDEGSVEYQHIQSYLENTHAATHSNYKLDLQQVFKVRRQGEVERFAEFKHLHNHKLLWHGSRTTNFAGILSQGLRIAPPEAPVTGYMFGKGVYFADMVSKSANYCFTSAANPVGLMLLSEVALGNMKELKEAKSITRLAVATHSVKGVGRTHPDPTESVLTEDGMEIPLGHAMDSGVQGTSLLYNEYIVYKEAQVHIRYLLQVKFEYHL